MQEGVASVLGDSIKRQADHHCAQVHRQSRPHGGFLLKVNGTQLQAAAAPPRKRPRDTHESQQTAHDSSGERLGHRQEDSKEADWPIVVLEALTQVVTSVEQQADDTDVCGSSGADASSSSSLVQTLRSLTGIEVRHCKLQAPHIATDGGGGCASLTHLLLQPQRLWNSSAAAACSSSMCCSSLTTLDLECNALGDAGVEVLSTHLVPHLPRLQRLLLASNGVTAAGFLSLLRALNSASEGSSTTPLPLETLGLTNNAVGCGDDDEAFAEWSSALHAFVRHYAATLRRIHLNHAALATRDAVAIVAALFQHTCADRATCLFDLVYLRENKGIDKTCAVEEVCEAVSDKDALGSFVEQHVSW